MFVGNLTPVLIITGACGIASGTEFADVQIALLQNAMLIAGIVTLIQLYAIGPIGGKVPIIMGTSSGFIGVCSSVASVMGGGILGYGAIMGASIIGGLFESVLGFMLKPLRRFFPAVVTGTVVLSIGLSLIGVGVNSFGGGNSANDFGSIENLLLGTIVLVIIIALKHGTKGITSASSVLIGIIAGYIILMVCHSKIYACKIIFDARAIVPVLIMFINCCRNSRRYFRSYRSGMDREATDSELSGGVVCDGIGSTIAAFFGKFYQIHHSARMLVLLL